jgi:hypothetical protein
MRNKKEATDKYTQEVLLYFSFDFLKNWKKELDELNQNKTGKRYQFPNSLIEFCAKTKFMFRIGWRQVKGVLISLKNWIPIPNIPSKSQINYRFNLLDFDMKDTILKTQSQNIALDSSGIKLRFSGQWIREKHNEKRPFLKLHLAVNTKTHQAVAMELTDDGISDISQAKGLIVNSEKVGKVKKSFMDGAYDKIKLWKWCEEKKIKPFIRLRKNAKPNGLSKRSKEAKRMRKIGHEEWMNERGMGEREPVEGYYSVFKRRLGEFCWARKIENIVQEIKFKIRLCNQLIVKKFVLRSYRTEPFYT